MKKKTASPLFMHIAAATEAALREAVIFLPPDVKRAIGLAAARETSPIAQAEFSSILKNIAVAEELGVPLCQDTGVPVVYLTVPPDLPLAPEMFDAVAKGVRMATVSIPLRPSVVDPISRHNSGDNTGERVPAVHIRPGKTLSVTVLPKGAGAENVSRVAMLLPSQKGQIARFVAETVLLAEGRPCPPVVLGVGIGGTFDQAAALAKESLLLPIDSMTEFEQGLCDAVNRLGIGPMGIGGDTTALAVKVMTAACHTASLPVAVNVQCWACRRATVEVKRK